LTAAVNTKKAQENDPDILRYSAVWDSSEGLQDSVTKLAFLKKKIHLSSKTLRKHCERLNIQI
jgi:hypothetical protein